MVNNTKMKNERKIFYGTIAGIIAIGVILGIFFSSGAVNNDFNYLSAPAGAYHYASEIKISKSAVIPHVNTIPNLILSHKSFSYDNTKNIADKFDMKNPRINEYSDYYDASTGNASLSVYKNGYKIAYIKEKVDMVNVTMNDDKLIEVANGYLDRFKEYIPSNVNIKVHSVVNDRFDETVFDNGTIIDVYYTKDVIYDCYYKGYFVGLILKVELDHNGNLAGFETMPVKVIQNGYINIKSFSNVHKWMESGLPVTVPPKLIKSVEIRNVTIGILPTPTTFGAKFVPAYIVNIHIVGIDPAANDDYTLDIGGIET